MTNDKITQLEEALDDLADIEKYQGGKFSDYAAVLDIFYTDYEQTIRSAIEFQLAALRAGDGIDPAKSSDRSGDNPNHHWFYGDVTPPAAKDLLESETDEFL